MKKKKLLATIASLCLAICLLAFGVYAAGAVTFNVSSTVTYTFDDVLVDVTAKLYKVSTGTSTIISSSGLAGLTDADNWQEVSGGVTNGTLKSYTGSDGVYTQSTPSSTVNSSITFNMNTSFAYKVEIAFTTLNTNGVTVDYNSTTFVETAGDNITLVVNANAENKTITPGETYTFTYYVLLEDATKEVSISLPALSLTATKAS